MYGKTGLDSSFCSRYTGLQYLDIENMNVLILRCLHEFIYTCKYSGDVHSRELDITSYDEGSGIAIEVVPPCHRISEPLR